MSRTTNTKKCKQYPTVPTCCAVYMISLEVSFSNHPVFCLEICCSCRLKLNAWSDISILR